MLMVLLRGLSKERLIMTKIRDLRSKSGESLSAFSRKIGLHYANACQFERGDMRVPPKWQSAIAEALGVTVEEIFDDRGFARESE